MGRNVLLNNQGDGTFIDQTTSAGVEDTYVSDLLAVGWGTEFFDYDNDGYLDLIVNNGELPTLDFVANDPDNPNKLFRNNRDGTFADISAEAGFNSPWRGRGLAVGDIDNDGDEDVVAVVIERYNTSFIHTLLYENMSENTNHWINVELLGRRSNREGRGSHVWLYSNGRKFLREASGGASHLSISDGPLHFGLAGFQKIDSILIEWPGGNKQTVTNINIIDSTVYITEESSIIEVDETICGSNNSQIILSLKLKSIASIMVYRSIIWI